MVSIKDSLDKLELYLLELEEKYIDTHDDPLEDPDKYKLDVRSYCVLSHAAFEEFVENICLYTLNEIEDKFINTQRISYDNNRIYDYLLGQIKSIKSEFSRYIMNQNHGVGLKYLKKLLVPLGLYTPIDIRLKPSLENLTKYRGGYAHSSHRNIRSLSPEDSRTYVRDVYEIMVELAKKSSNIFYYSIH